MNYSSKHCLLLGLKFYVSLDVLVRILLSIIYIYLCHHGDIPICLYVQYCNITIVMYVMSANA